jgi:hypothetical protein
MPLSEITQPYVDGDRPSSPIAIGSIEMCWRNTSAMKKLTRTKAMNTRSRRTTDSPGPRGTPADGRAASTGRVSRTLKNTIDAVTTVVAASTRNSSR